MVSIWGTGPIGQFVMRSAILLGAKQIIVIDRVPEPPETARSVGAIAIFFAEESVLDRFRNEARQGAGEMIDAVGMESHATGSSGALYDRARQAVVLETAPPASAARDDLRVLSGGRVVDADV